MATVRGRSLSSQGLSDFFSSATRNINITVWTVRVIAAVMLFIYLNIIWVSLDPEVKEMANFWTLIDLLTLIFFTLVLALLTFVAFIPSMIGIGSVDADTKSFIDFHYILAARAFVTNQIFGDVNIPDYFDENVFFGSGNDPLSPFAYLINKPQRILYNTEVMYGLILLGLLLMIITGIGFIRRSSVSLAGMTLVIGQLIIGLAYLKDLTLEFTLDTSSVGSMLGSSLFQLAFISYLYFEFSLQTGYLYNLTTPTLSRQQRVGKQLSRLSEFRLGITRLGTDEQKETDTATKESQFNEEEEERTSSALAAGSSSTTARKYSSDALVFLLDSASDSLFTKPGGEQERLTGRLQRYHDGLLQHDPKLDDKLGGSAEKAFNPFTVLFVVITSLIFRVFVLVLFAWLVINPEVLLEFISLPPSIVNSIEIHEPEGLLMVLIPVVFLIIGGSYLIARLQEWVVKAEELIIEEGEIAKLIKEGKAITSREQAEQMQAEEAAKQAEQVRSETGDGTRPIRRRRKRKRPSKK